MTQKPPEVASDELRRALDGSAASQRLQAALAAGMNPNPGYVDVLIEQCAVEIDFYVRDMLTWALIRHDATSTVDRLLGELGSGVPQARSQALHTLSAYAWPRHLAESPGSRRKTSWPDSPPIRTMLSLLLLPS